MAVQKVSKAHNDEFLGPNFSKNLTLSGLAFVQASRLSMNG
jgi:hypothetical protein